VKGARSGKVSSGGKGIGRKAVKKGATSPNNDQRTAWVKKGVIHPTPNHDSAFKGLVLLEGRRGYQAIGTGIERFNHKKGKKEK